MTSKEQAPTAARFVVLVLCVALFACGLHGKSFGNKAPNHSHRKSLVRLVREDPTRQLAPSASVASRNPFLDFADLTAIYSQPRSITGRIQQVRESVPLPTPSQNYALHFRPPPSMT